MGYLFKGGSGYLKDAVQVASSIKTYLINKGGYLVDSIRIGYGDFGVRIQEDGGIIESYDCADDIIVAMPNADGGRQLFEPYATRVATAGGTTEARTCTIDELNELL